jgi:leucyl aminopeptidase (aminopeptidase T)
MPHPSSSRHSEAAQHLLTHCGSLKATESLLILCDHTTRDLADFFLQQALLITPRATLMEVPLAKAHGQNPPPQAAQAMLQASLVMSLCKFSLAHSRARMDAAAKHVRFLSMPLYTWELMSDPSITVDYKAQARLVRMVSDAFSHGKGVHVTTQAGTDIRLKIDGREGNFCPGFVGEGSLLGSPPDIEANVSPREDQSEGRVVIDGSITCPELGLLADPVTLTVRNGRITRFESRNPEYVAILEKMFEDAASKRRVLAECGVGLNPLARLTGSMLTDEGALGCMHFGFGSNYTVGGQNNVDFHLDFVFRNASLAVDGKPIIVNGVIHG